MDPTLPIYSDEAYAAIGIAQCWKCQKKVRVVCLYCVRGAIDGDPCEHFVVLNLVDADAPLLEALRAFPDYRLAVSRTAGMSYFANHCLAWESLQGDFNLHSEPGDAFFRSTAEDVARNSFTPVKAPIRCRGAESFRPMARGLETYGHVALST